MTVLHLVRHGETIWHAENRYAGVSDVGLTARGVEQAAQLGRWAVQKRPVAIYTSTLSRSIGTAQPAADALGLTSMQEADLGEVDFGSGEGMTRQEMLQEFPRALQQFLARPAESQLPGGERGVDAITRARPVLQRIAVEHEGGVVLVVMHSTLVRLLLCSFLTIDPNEYRRILPRIDNVALNTVDIHPDRVSLFGLNVPI